VEAATPEEAHEIAVETWDDDDEAFDHLGVVHAEDFIEDVKKKTEAA
jgi:quinol monooxygenase YgiN